MSEFTQNSAHALMSNAGEERRRQERRQGERRIMDRRVRDRRVQDRRVTGRPPLPIEHEAPSCVQRSKRPWSEQEELSPMGKILEKEHRSQERRRGERRKSERRREQRRQSERRGLNGQILKPVLTVLSGKLLTSDESADFQRLFSRIDQDESDEV